MESLQGLLFGKLQGSRGLCLFVCASISCSWYAMGTCVEGIEDLSSDHLFGLVFLVWPVNSHPRRTRSSQLLLVGLCNFTSEMFLPLVMTPPRVEISPP